MMVPAEETFGASRTRYPLPITRTRYPCPYPPTRTSSRPQLRAASPWQPRRATPGRGGVVTMATAALTPRPPPAPGRPLASPAGSQSARCPPRPAPRGCPPPAGSPRPPLLSQPGRVSRSLSRLSHSLSCYRDLVLAFCPPRPLC